VRLSSLLVFCCLVFPSLSTLPSLHERFYRSINSAIPCFRLTNATHQIGCSASDTTTRGVLYFVDTNNTLDWLVNSGPHSPYIALLEPEMFTRLALQKYMVNMCTCMLDKVGFHAGVSTEDIPQHTLMHVLLNQKFSGYWMSS